MTTNIERAEEIMSEWAEVKRFAPDIAQQLASANPPILMPDLPPADEGEWENFGNVISLDGMHILPMIENDALTPDEARDIAYSLLAAADYAEQEQGNGA